MPEAFPKMLKSILAKVEMVSLVISGIGFLLLYLGRPESNNVLVVGVSSLAIVLFLTAFVLPPSSENRMRGQDEKQTKKGFMELIYLILWKIIHIGCAVTAIGILLYLIKAKGGENIILIGTAALIGSLFFSGVTILQKSENFILLKSSLIRAVPIVLIGSYILYRNWPLSI